MSFSHREWPESVDPVRSQTTPIDPASAAENVLQFSPDDTFWHRRICIFLSQHPESTLFALVQDLWPEFLSFPATRRAHSWFWAKEQLQLLKNAGIIRSREEADGVSLWSLMPAR